MSDTSAVTERRLVPRQSTAIGRRVSSGSIRRWFGKLPGRALACLALSIQAALTQAAPWELVVRFESGQPDHEIAIPLPDSGHWCLHWHHSVQGFLVRDCFRVDASGTLLLDTSYQPDFAAGLDHIPGRGRLESDGEGGYIIENINEPVPGNRLRLRVGSQAVDHRIVTADASVSLSERAAHESVSIRPRPVQQQVKPAGVLK